MKEWFWNAYERTFYIVIGVLYMILCFPFLLLVQLWYWLLASLFSLRVPYEVCFKIDYPVKKQYWHLIEGYEQHEKSKFKRCGKCWDYPDKPKRRMTMPKVSMVLLAYKRDHYLPALLNCLLNQTFKDFELIVLDDGLSDSCKAIVEAQNDPRLSYVRPKHNLGVPGSFKRALELARGEYFMWVQDDDLYQLNFLERCLEAHIKPTGQSPCGGRLPTPIVAFPPMQYVDREGDRVGGVKRFTFAHNQLQEFLYLPMSSGKNQLLCGLWRKELITDTFDTFYWGFDPYFLFVNLATFRMVPATGTMFFRGVRRSIQKAEPLLDRLIKTLYYRVKKLFSPYFWKMMKAIYLLDLPVWDRLKLEGLNLFVMTRLFWSRDI